MAKCLYHLKNRFEVLPSFILRRVMIFLQCHIGGFKICNECPSIDFILQINVQWKPYWLVVIYTKYILLPGLKGVLYPTCTCMCWFDEDDTLTANVNTLNLCSYGSVLWNICSYGHVSNVLWLIIHFLIDDWNHNLILICVRCTRCLFFSRQ